tara:strand:+ start:732 stop:2381 length:1650 start_codon:yes stop_codon:yes gene_type:complete
MLKDFIEDKIRISLSDKSKSQFTELDISKLVLSIPNNPDHGDFSTNFALINAKALKLKPLELAKEISIVLDNEDSNLFESVTVEKPGFINFKISKKIYHEFLAEVLIKGENFGSFPLNGKKILIEFVSANPTGLLHLGHLRNAAVGDSIARILKFSGYSVTTEYYINDYGNQIRLLGESLKSRVMQKLKLESKIPEEGYKGEYLLDVAELLLSEVNSDDLLSKDCEFFSNYAIKYLINEIDKDLKDLDINFDSWYSERDQIHNTDLLSKTRDLIKLGQGLYEKDDAEWIKTSEYGDNDDWVIKKRDDATTYFMNDIAYHHDKFQRGFDSMVNIWGADHHSHISRLKASMNLLSNDPHKLNFVLIQFVRLIKDGRDVSMSKRSGTYTTIRDMLSEFNKDLIRFMMVSRSSDSHFDFDLDKCREGSDDNPIFYIQYASARINSILNKDEVVKFTESQVDLSLLIEDKEINIIKKILNFPDIILDASNSMSPHKLAFYLQELSALFHSYYRETKILVDERELSGARLFLLRSLKTVFTNGLTLLGVSSPERM